MSKTWRFVAIAATVCGLTAATAATAGSALATQAAPSVSINVTSLIPKVTHDLYVVFENGKYSAATISGSVSGATSGEVAVLYAQPFKSKSAPVPGATVTLTGSASQTYSFSEKPSVATKYTVKVFPSSTSATAVAKSATDIVYVITRQALAHNKVSCPRPLCHETIRITTRLPASAYKKEAGKKLYFYLGVRLSASGNPGIPKTLKLTSATISRATKISATEFSRTVSFSFRIGPTDAASWEFAWCTKNTESKDGINLPGHHGCGDKKISSRITFLGALKLVL